MEIVALSIALIALFLTLSTRSRIAELSEQLAARPSSGSGAGLEELSDRVKINSRFLARMAAGEILAPHQVREGELWADVSPEEAFELVKKGARVIDVRSPQETASGIIPGAICIPVDELPNRMDELPRDHSMTVIYCSVGGRSAAACQYLSEKGYDSLVNMDGGFGSWPGEKERP